MIQAPSHVARVDTPGGYDTTSWTVQALAKIVRDQHLDPMLRRRYREVTYGLPSMDYDEEIAAVWDFVNANLRYQRDPVGAEHITVPSEIDRQIREEGAAAEDCESIALYAATLFAAGGLKSEFEIQGRDPSRPEKFSHCSLRVHNPRSGQWTSFDPVGAYAFPDSFTLGDSLAVPGAPLERWNLDGERVESTLDGMFGAPDTGTFLGDCFGDAAGDLATAKAVGDPIAKAISGFGPYGALVGGAFELGTGIAQSVVGTPKPMVAHFTPSPAAVQPVQAVADKGGASSSGKAGRGGKGKGGKGAAADAGGATTIPTWGYALGAIVLAKLIGVI